MKLLYLDDDEVDHMAFSRLARKFPSIQLFAARDIPAALEIFKSHEPDIILTDYYLGADKLDEYAHRFEQRPFFVLSGKEELEDEAFLRKQGMIKSFRKPISEEHIRQVLEWFGENDEEEEASPTLQGSYLDYLTQGDKEYRNELLKKLVAELEMVLEKLKRFLVVPEKQAFLLTVHQLKYKTTLLGADETLRFCKKIEEELRLDDGNIPEMSLQLYNMVAEMKDFAVKLSREA